MITISRNCKINDCPEIALLSAADSKKLPEIGRAHVCSSHLVISYAVFCLKKKKRQNHETIFSSCKIFVYVPSDRYSHAPLIFTTHSTFMLVDTAIVSFLVITTRTYNNSALI